MKLNLNFGHTPNYLVLYYIHEMSNLYMAFLGAGDENIVVVIDCGGTPSPPYPTSPPTSLETLDII